MTKFFQPLLLMIVAVTLSACVTQNFEKDVPVVENHSSMNEMAMTRISLGLGYLKMGNNAQAKFNLEKAKKFSPGAVEVYTAFAHYYETVEEPELTVAAYEKALSLSADDANTLNNYGVYLCRQEQYEAGEQQLLKAIAVPSYVLVSESYENLASCQLKANDFDKAQLYLGKSIMHSPNRASALFQMARLEYARGNYKKSRTYIQRNQKSTRRFNTESLTLAVKIYQKLGNQKSAKNYGSMLVKMFPQSWDAKQYILNGLDHTELDDLAEKYQQFKSKNTANNKPKKRMVVLSPNKKPVVVEASELKQEVNSKTPEQETKDFKVANNSAVANENTEQESIEQENKAQQGVEEKNTDGKSIAEIDDKLALETKSKSEEASLVTKVDTVKKKKQKLVHKVVKGDTLFNLSAKYNIRLKSLKRWNHLKGRARLFIGDQIYLFDPVAAVTNNE